MCRTTRDISRSFSPASPCCPSAASSTHRPKILTPLCRLKCWMTSVPNFRSALLYRYRRSDNGNRPIQLGAKRGIGTLRAGRHARQLRCRLYRPAGRPGFAAGKRAAATAGGGSNDARRVRNAHTRRPRRRGTVVERFKGPNVEGRHTGAVFVHPAGPYRFYWGVLLP